MTQDTNTASGAADQPDALIERLKDAVYEWGNYVDEDHAPRPLTRHVDPHIKAIAAELQRLRAALASAAAPAEQPGPWRPFVAPSGYAVVEHSIGTTQRAYSDGWNDATDHHASRGQAPAGWAIVPADATDAMMAAFAKAAAADIDWHGATEVERQEVRDGFGPAYRAMLAAVPVPRPDSVLEDAARLDWLESQSQVNIERVRYLGADTSIYEVTPFNSTDYNGETLREAIDAARKQGANHD